MARHIGMLLYPGLTQLDLTVRADSGLTILPTTAIADCPALDLVCVHGSGPEA